MSNEKSEAQLKNEVEVKRILEERGYSPASSKKRVAKTFGKSFSLKPLITVLAVTVLLAGGWMYLQNNSLNNSSRTTSDGMVFTDGEWLSDSQMNPENTEANDMEYQYSQAENDEQYQEALAKNKAEYERKKAELDAETSQKLKAFDQQREERNAQYAAEQAERERRAAAIEAQQQQREQVAKAKCDDYKATYGDKTAAEIAEADSEVIKAKYNWTQAQKKVRSCTGGNIVYNASQREQCNLYRNQELQTAESHWLTYTNLLQQKTVYYGNLKIDSCGY